ncbi:MAG: alpha-galactosidase, partial [Clostridia bacterium]|nr:alpha-galactosidase [Clostridia bacterium]
IIHGSRPLKKMIAENVKVDIRWFDAGWYTAPDGSSPVSDWWGTVGTWELDPVKWPDTTFLESTEFARENGTRTLMWFEPERVTDVENLVKNYGYDPAWAIRREGVGSISNNIGIPACYDWTVGRICKVLAENKVGIYREDNNSDPGALWKYLDTLEGDNRTGITECRFVDGHYRMWDDIIACTLSFGGSGFVDSCASGGGRNDLESLRRGVPLLRSDADRTTTALRLSMTTGFNKWIPFCGANTKEKVGELDATGRTDVYTWRASYLPALNVDSQFTQDPDQDFSILRFGLHEWAKLKKYLLKDFYVLTPWHDKNDRAGFTAYAFVDEDEQRGAVLAFRMEDCEDDTLTVKLPFADSDGDCPCRWKLTDEDTGETWTTDGEMTLTFAEKREARLIWVEKE